jgi:hypothetical protein
MAIGEHAARKRLEAADGARRRHGVIGRLRSALARALFADPQPEPRARREPGKSLVLLDDAVRPTVLRTRREQPPLNEAEIMAAQRERALRRVAAAATEACDDWARGLDLDDAMIRLRAELQTAAEYEA